MYLFSDTDERLISPGMGEEARKGGKTKRVNMWSA